MTAFRQKFGQKFGAKFSLVIGLVYGVWSGGGPGDGGGKGVKAGVVEVGLQFCHSLQEVLVHTLTFGLLLQSLPYK